MKLILGGILGAVVGYYVFYKLIGCSSGSCPITSNRYVSTLYGMVMGILISAGI
jgi:hypothetical protein